MFKRKQYQMGSSAYTEAAKTNPTEKQPIQTGGNAGVGSLLGEMASSFVNSQAGKDILQGFSVAAGGPTNEQVDTFAYKVNENKKARDKGMDEPFPTPASDLTGIGGEGQTGPTAMQRWAERTRQPTQSVAMALQRMSSGVGAHPGGAGRGKGAGGSLGQEARQAMKRKRLSKRIANRKAKEDNDYAEGGRVGLYLGGLPKMFSKAILKKYSKDPKTKKLVEEIKEFETRIDEHKEIVAKQEQPEDVVKRLEKETGEPVYSSWQDLATEDMIELVYMENHLAKLYDDLLDIRDVNELQRIKNKSRSAYYDPDAMTDWEMEMGGSLGRKYTTPNFDEIDPADTVISEFYSKRKPKALGGNVDEQMVDMMEGPTHTMPEGTVHPGATHEEYEQMLAEGQAEDMAQEGMVPDEQMEEDFVDYVVESTLEPEDTMYLEEALAADPRLSEIFDQVIETASEFSGSGPVEGPGSEVSDSIPARLSDGEFVITAKATEEIGPDNLQGMMEQAEMDADVRRAEAEGGYIDDDEDTAMINPMQRTVNATEREMRKLQLAANPRTQYRTVYG